MILNLVCPQCGNVVTKAEKEKLARNLGKKLKCKSCGDSVVVAKTNIRKEVIKAPQPKIIKKASSKKRNKKLIECKDCGETMSKTAKRCPHCGAKKAGSSIVKLGCGTIFAFFVFVTVIGSLGTENHSSSSDAVEVKAIPVDAVAVSAGEIFDSYQSNEVKADQLFKGVLLKVSGTVSSIDSGFSDKAIVNLKTSNPFMSVQGQGDKVFTEVAGELTKGQKITMTCVGGGEIVGMPLLEDCNIH